VAGRIQRLHKGLYAVVDAARETPLIAIASGVFAEVEHYVTTDAALAERGLIDQPIPTLTVVLQNARRPFLVGRKLIRPVTMAPDLFSRAAFLEKTVEGFKVRLARPEQAVVDALAEPGWMVHRTLLSEVLAAFSRAEVREIAARALRRSHASAQRLGYLLEDAGRSAPPLLAAFRPVSAVEMRPGLPRGPYSTRWRVYG
jgi:predicted transcriptional regulator of viral defense system